MERKYQCVNVVASGHTAVNMSRLSLLQWINEILSVKVRKVEALCSGVVYCQLMDILFPGCMPLHKIKLKANVMNEYWSNFKQLQIAFKSVGCEKDVPIDRLIEGRFQENFEFLQWFKRFFDVNADHPSSPKSTPTGPKTSTPSTSREHARPVAIVNPVLSRSHMANDLKSKIAKYEEKAQTLIRERDFFFVKLREVELLCSADDALKMKKKDLVNKVLTVLYASEGDESPNE